MIHGVVPFLWRKGGDPFLFLQTPFSTYTSFIKQVFTFKRIATIIKSPNIILFNRGAVTIYTSLNSIPEYRQTHGLFPTTASYGCIIALVSSHTSITISNFDQTFLQSAGDCTDQLWPLQYSDDTVLIHLITPILRYTPPFCASNRILCKPNLKHRQKYYRPDLPYRLHRRTQPQSHFMLVLQAAPTGSCTHTQLQFPCK